MRMLSLHQCSILHIASNIIMWIYKALVFWWFIAALLNYCSRWILIPFSIWRMWLFHSKTVYFCMTFLNNTILIPSEMADCHMSISIALVQQSTLSLKSTLLSYFCLHILHPFPVTCVNSDWANNHVFGQAFSFDFECSSQSRKFINETKYLEILRMRLPSRWRNSSSFGRQFLIKYG